MRKRAFDAITLSKKSNKPCFLGFLNEHEACFLSDQISKKEDVRFFGGYENAQRVMLGACAGEDDFPIRALRFFYSSQFSLRHKDFLGAMLSLGIARESVGDILISTGYAVAFVTEAVAPLLLSELKKIGSVGVRVDDEPVDVLPETDEGEEIVITISSLRLDVFTKTVCALSREKAESLIKSGLVTLNHQTVQNPSKTLRQGDTITVRKYGKFVFAESLGASKKGKLRVKVKRFR